MHPTNPSATKSPNEQATAPRNDRLFMDSRTPSEPDSLHRALAKRLLGSTAVARFARNKVRMVVRYFLAFVALAFAGCSANSVHGGNNEPVEERTPAPTPELPACILFCRDADGDAWGGGKTVSAGCEEEPARPPSGFAVCFEDCDDDDASVYAWAAPDIDGDGFRPSGSEETCIGALPGG